MSGLLAKGLLSAGKAAPISKRDRLILEVKTGGLQQCCGLDQADWGQTHGGQIYEFWKCEPCCGERCNPKEAAVCFFHFYCCHLCTVSRMLAGVLNQKWAVWPHCVCLYCCASCTHAALRYNLRKAAGVPGNICGDFWCLYFCGPCALAQELRSVPKNKWEWIPDHMEAPEMTIPEVDFIK
jgi:hypothetical protein